MPRVYASLPLTGPAARYARDLLRGMQLSLEGRPGAAVELVWLDSFAPDRDAAALAHARRAAADGEAIAYLGDFHSSQVHVTQPVLAEAGLLQVAPVATWVGLGGPTLVRLSPHDGVGAHAIADWLVAQGIEELLVVHDHDEGYGIPVAAMCVDAARARGAAVRVRPVWDAEEEPAGDVDGADAVLYVGVAGSGAVGLWHGLHALDPRLWLLGSEGVALPWLARALEPAAAARTRFWVAQRASFSPYGFEAMALVLDALAAGATGRAALVERVRATSGRDSVIGPYSLDADGHTTSSAYGRVVPLNGELVWDL